jgi:hypothetical protein
MPAPRELQRGATRLLSVAMVLVGLAMLVITLANGGGPISYGVFLGVLFVAAGIGRLWVASRHD